LIYTTGILFVHDIITEAIDAKRESSHARLPGANPISGLLPSHTTRFAPLHLEKTTKISLEKNSFGALEPGRGLCFLLHWAYNLKITGEVEELEGP